MVGCGRAGAPASVSRPTATLGASSGTIVNGGMHLAYSIDLPAGVGPFPGVVLGHGSGRVTRDQLQFFAGQLTSLGFAVLRFDKRGVGESTGVYSSVGVANSLAQFADLSSDVAAAARFLRAQPGIDARRVGLAGASQAGWILPLAARELGDAAFMVLLSGPVCSVGLEIYYSDLAEFTSTPIETVYTQLPSFAGPHGFDPMATLRAIQTPTLWVLGLDDRSIPIRTTLDNLNTLAGEGKPFQWKTYPGLDHSLSSAIWADIGVWLARFKA
jgi:pimeloyl-ACP methyl ester carboxylesterase